MSRHPKSSPAPKPKTPTDAKSPVTPDPANSLPQVKPVTTDAASADAKAAAEAAAASVDPKTDAPPVPPVTPPEAKTEAPKTKKPVLLRVKGPANGRWRAGRHFTPEPVDIPMADLSDEDLQKLQGDPALICTVIGAPA